MGMALVMTVMITGMLAIVKPGHERLQQESEDSNETINIVKPGHLG